jgi:hypothetical protein
VTSGSAWDDVALVLNYQDARNFYFVSFNEQDDAETNGIFRVLEGTVTELASLSRTVDVGSWHTLKVSRTPDTLTAWVDGVSVGTGVRHFASRRFERPGVVQQRGVVRRLQAPGH